MLLLAKIFCAAMINAVMAQNSANASKLTIFKEDSGNLSEMNWSLYTTFKDFGINGLFVGEVVKFTALKPGWKIKGL